MPRSPWLPLLNLGAALYLVAGHREWFGRPAWAIALIGVGLGALGAGLTLDRAERRTQRAHRPGEPSSVFRG